MKISVLRKKIGEKGRWQIFEYEPKEPGETVASALNNINRTNPGERIIWDCGCLQKKCGACAMVINDRPTLACAVKLADIKGGLRLEALRKFPIIEDLMVDRTVLRENLLNAREWLEEEAVMNEKKQELLYEASRCLQCGCCLEVCPQFMPGDKFFGTAAAVPMIRLINCSKGDEKKRLRKEYYRHVYSGCGKSLSCRNICPAGIDVDRLLVSR